MCIWQSQDPAGATSRGAAPPVEFGTACEPTSAEVIRSKLDRLAVRGAVGGPIPRVVIARERIARGDALLGDQPFERREPVVIVGLAGVGIAGRLRTLDFRGERRGPLSPG